VRGHFNLWRGFGVEPKAGDCSLWLASVHEDVCSGNETHYRYVLEWCADAIQNPTERPGVVLVLRGPQGTGKGTFARTLGKLFGDHFLHIRHARHLTGNFNAHLSNVLMLFADEAYFPGDKTGEGALKALITEPTIPLEYKGKDVISVNNYIRVIMASNNDWVVPAAMEDRRFAIFDVDNKHAQDTNYFGAIIRQLETGGYEALLQHLLDYPLGDVDLRKIPDTEARREQQAMSLDPFYAFWLQWLQDPVRDATGSNFYITSLLYDDYKKSTAHPINAVAFAMRLCKLFPGATRARQVSKDKEFGRFWGYEMPALEVMRKNFAAAVGRTIDWPPEEVPVSQLAQVAHPDEPPTEEKP
jgi:phage/plasmid-associated DNA primase